MNLWKTFIAGLVTGGLGLRLIDYLIAWARERREQKNSKTAHEKDRPRFRVDPSVDESGHPNRPTVVVKILSLGGLPLTINDGYIAVETPKYPESISPYQLRGKEISPIAPIIAELPTKLFILQSSGLGEAPVKLICKFSYGKNETYEREWIYNKQSRNFE
jgi:hypothetical protein